jgi:hypothetical protein
MDPAVMQGWPRKGMTTRRAAIGANARMSGSRPDRSTQPAPVALVAQRSPAVSQAARILRCLSTAPAPLGVSAVARELGLSPSSCFNILRTLVAEGLLAFDPVAKTYSLGLGLVEIASSALGMGYLDLIRPASPCGSTASWRFGSSRPMSG